MNESNGIATFKGLEGLFSNVISAALALSGITLFVLLVIGGFKFITAGGEPPAIESARKTITFAIAGIVMVAMSYLFLRLIGSFTGIDLTQFKVFQG